MNTFQFNPETNQWEVGPAPTGSGGGSYIHTQSVADTIWLISHKMGFYPNVTVIDSSQRKVLTDIEYIDANNLKVLVTAAFAGVAYLS